MVVSPFLLFFTTIVIFERGAAVCVSVTEDTVIGEHVSSVQINKAYHAVTGEAYSEEHVQQGVVFLIQLIKTMERMKQDWTKEQQLKGKDTSALHEVKRSFRCESGVLSLHLLTKVTYLFTPLFKEH